ncbi:response regulator [Halorubrum sp. F4]|uniref:response regulator n=1 Tax=Halorubrum sp. F4 TaxID=2989715 RepID=UPI0024818A83|nr:response regulator [Halorubrum sp. F4]
MTDGSPSDPDGSSPARSSSDGSSPDGSTPTVLAVDDEPDLAELCRVYLDGRYDVRIATSGETALEEIDDDVDVVLLDRRMPDLSGHEVLSEIRSAGYDARVAMLTAVEPDVDIVDMPFDDYKTKPVTREGLIALVEVLLERAAFDERSQQFFALASKKAALEASGTTDTEEYDELVERMEAVRTEVDETLDRLSVEDAFAEISTNVS